MRGLFVSSDARSLKAIVDQVRHQMPTLDATMVAEVGDALQRVGTSSPDAIILDLARPHASARGTLQQFVSSSEISLFVIGRGDDGLGPVNALELGADDYTRAQGGRELVARIVAFLRRLERTGRKDTLVKAGPLSINPSTKEVLLDGVKLKLSVDEYRLLLLLTSSHGQPLSGHFLQEALWGSQKNTGRLSRTAARLNNKLTGKPSSPRWIAEDRAEYRFVGPTRAA